MDHEVEAEMKSDQVRIPSTYCSSRINDRPTLLSVKTIDQLLTFLAIIVLAKPEVHVFS